MQSSLSVEEFLSKIKKKYKSDRIVALLFARYGIGCTNDILNRNFDYLHCNSGKALDIFMPGYGKYKYHEEDLEEKEYIVDLTNNRLGWSFSIPKFIEFKKQLQKASTWRYEDEVQLVFLDFKFGKLSFENYISINVEKAIHKQYISTLRELFEVSIQIIEDGVTDISKFSNKLASYYGKEAITECILANIPLNIGKSGWKLSPFATKKK